MSGPQSRPATSRPPARAIALALLAAVPAAALPGAASAQSLRGSRASIERMHGQAVSHDLHFYETASGVRQAVKEGKFTRLSGNGDYRLHLVSFPYVTDETALFVERLASQYRAACGERMVVTSAMRPSTRQPANSADLSVHPTGMAVDLRKPTRGKCLTFLRTTLLALEDEGVIEATEERRPPHFHVAVFPRPYARYAGGATRLATAAASDATETEDAVEERAAAPAPKATRGSRAASRRSAVRRHKVRSGDTLWHLARRYGTTVKRLRSVNHLTSSELRPGQQIVIPGP